MSENSCAFCVHKKTIFKGEMPCVDARSIVVFDYYCTFPDTLYKRIHPAGTCEHFRKAKYHELQPMPLSFEENRNE